jgi:beta-lactamase class A
VTQRRTSRSHRRVRSFLRVALAYAAAVALLGALYLLTDNDDRTAAQAGASTTTVTSPARSSVDALLIVRTPAALDALRQRITAYLAEQTGTYGFSLAVHDGSGAAGTWLSVGDHEATPFKMASTFKLPLVLYLYTLAHQGKLRLTERMVYDEDFYQDGAGSLRYDDPGDSYTLQDLATRAIRQSDNVAQAMLTSRLGRQHVLDFMAGLGGSAFYREGNPWDTPSDLVRYLRAANDFARQDADLGGRLMSDLTHTEFPDRIRAGTPAGVVVAHKTGNLIGVVNDVALVKAPAGDYYLALMSSGVLNDEAGAVVEKRVAQMVYQAIGH